jgi:hypothetical protein
MRARPELQIDEDETALTAEGSSCLIVLIPHRALGGVSIVVWLFDDRAAVTWAQVAGLDRYHDALDLGISVAQFRLDSANPDVGPVLECIRKQIDEPLVLRCFAPIARPSLCATMSASSARLEMSGAASAGLTYCGARSQLRRQ